MIRYSRDSRAPVSRLLPALFALLMSFSGIAGAASELPSLGENSAINIARETSLGRSVYDRLLNAGVIETNPLLDRYINDLGFRLLAGVENRVRDYRFFILRDDSVNAFALPGGFIGINRGLIMRTRSQHQLASVLAHEIAHVELMHGMESLQKGSELSNAALLALLAGIVLGSIDSQAGTALAYGGAAGSQQAMVNFTRENEYEADRVGVELMHRAQFKPEGMVEFFKIMTELSGSGGIEYLRTHPINNNRIAEAVSRASKLPPGRDQVDDYELFRDYLLYASQDHLAEEGSKFRRALALVKKADYRAADASLTKLYESDNESIWYSVVYADNLEQLGREAEAELIYRRLLDIFPGDYVLSMRLLRLLKADGRFDTALDIARQLEIDYPDERQVYFELSEIYGALQRPALRLMAQAEFHRIAGNPQQAIRLYDEVLKSNNADRATLSKAREKRLALVEE